MIFTFSSFDGARASCDIHACSESQGFSVKDFSTNYCNLRNLYCGSTEGCVPVKHDFETSEEEVTPSWFGGSDKDACIVKSEAETALATVATVATVATPMLRQVPLGGVEDTLGCVSNNCPMDKATLQPSAMCVLGNCTSNLAKCLFSGLLRPAEGHRFQGGRGPLREPHGLHAHALPRLPAQQDLRGDALRRGGWRVRVSLDLPIRLGVRRRLRAGQVRRGSGRRTAGHRGGHRSVRREARTFDLDEASAPAVVLCCKASLGEVCWASSCGGSSAPG
ncbi:unnamed protein product [Effrenium voratum]|uniref:Uncharacterized protein n=1 Tax=Effrenium voratum TaxID=2562239 RepID=A0AA36I7Q5_9DINO|nr:unnamed protein product [Effrenium voratum]CAJ1415768.1 unnamed protein product [Effrenium voratum]